MTEKTATISVSRSSRLKDSLRDYKIRIDGEFVGGVASGQKQEFKVSPGRHTIQAAISQTGSKYYSLTVRDGETVQLEVDLAGSSYSPWREFSNNDYLKLTTSREGILEEVQNDTPRGMNAKSRLALVVALAVLLGVIAFSAGWFAF